MKKNKDQDIKYSVILLHEQENDGFFRFATEIYNIFESGSEPFEMVILANGTGGILRNMYMKKELTSDIRIFEMTKKVSQAVCLKSMLKDCRGMYFIVCGSYQQITLDSFKKLLSSVDQNTDIINPWRQHRNDPFLYRIQSTVFNKIVTWITGVKIHDLSCNVRIFRREILEQIDLYGNMYRFLPILADHMGFKTMEVKCDQYERHGEPRRGMGGFYFLSVYLSRIIDVFTLYFNTSFTRKPLRFFSAIGVISIVIGLLCDLMIFIQKIFYGYPVGNRTLLIFAMFLLLLGVQCTSAGLLGEVIVFAYGRRKKDYEIEKTI